MNFTDDEKITMSSIAQGNATEYLCLFLFKYLQQNLDNIEVNHMKIKDILITHYNVWWSQKCDLKVEIIYHNSEITQNLYVESKSYLTVDDDTACSKSIEKSVLEFIKKKISIEFWDIYMIFIPWHNNLNNVDFLEQSSYSKDCLFPRYFFQMSNDQIQKQDLEVLINSIDKYTLWKKKLEAWELDILYDNLLTYKVFHNISKSFVKKLQVELWWAITKYIKDDVFELECYKKYYIKPNLDTVPTSKNLINWISDLFKCSWIDISKWEEGAKQFSKDYLLRKYGYTNYPTILNKIESHESWLFGEIVESVSIYSYSDQQAFDNKIIDEIRGVTSTDYQPFLREVLVNNGIKKGLFYLRSSDGKYKIIHDKNFIFTK